MAGAASIGRVEGTQEAATSAPTVSVDLDHLTSPGAVMGTVAYMSPEQVRGQEVDARSDVFSFGAVLYEMATGRRAFSGNSGAEILTAILRDRPIPPSQVNPELPAKLEGIILKALEKERDVRYQSASQLKAHLQQLKEDEPSTQTAIPSASAKRGRRTRWWLP